MKSSDYTLKERQARKPIRSPLKAIRAHCLECLVGSTQDIKNCTGPLLIGDDRVCWLHPYRFGRRSKFNIKATRPTLRAIREHCTWCMCGSAKERGLCTADKCWLWPFRNGKNPYLPESFIEMCKKRGQTHAQNLKKA